jgi:hypothetical protein
VQLALLPRQPVAQPGVLLLEGDPDGLKPS